MRSSRSTCVCPDARTSGRTTGRLAAGVDFLANTDPDHGCEATVQVRATGRVETWDAAAGTVSDLPMRVQGDLTELVLDFPPGGSHLVVLDPGVAPAEPAERTERGATERGVTEIVLDNCWRISQDQPNCWCWTRRGSRSRGWNDRQGCTSSTCTRPRPGPGPGRVLPVVYV